MGDFNEVYVILYKDEKDSQIKPIMNNDGGMRLFMTWTKAYNVAQELTKNTSVPHYPHSFEIDRTLFE